MYSSEKYGTFWLQGAILKTYQGLGGSGSFLGFPTRDQYLLQGAWAADFEGGTVLTVDRRGDELTAILRDFETVAGLQQVQEPLTN